MRQSHNLNTCIFPTLHNKKIPFSHRKEDYHNFFGVCSAGGARSLDLRIMNPTL